MKEFSKRRTDAVKGLRRYRFLFPPKNKYCLVGLKRHPDNWQLVVLTGDGNPFVWVKPESFVLNTNSVQQDH